MCKLLWETCNFQGFTIKNFYFHQDQNYLKDRWTWELKCSLHHWDPFLADGLLNIAYSPPSLTKT